MKKTIIISIILSIFLFSCKKSTKTTESDNSTSDTTAISDNSQIDFYHYEGDASFDDFLSFFKEYQLPYNFSIWGCYNDTSLCLPEQFNKYIDEDILKYIDSSVLPVYIIPEAKIKMSDKKWIVYYLIGNTESFYTSVLATFDNNIRIDSKEIHLMCYNETGVEITIDKDYNVLVVINWPTEVEWAWQYDEDSKTASNLSYHTENNEEINYKITNGKIIDIKQEKTEPTIIDSVRYFLNDLAKSDKTKAFKMQKNPNWGDYEKFSSPNAFGGIVNIGIDTLIALTQTDNSAEVQCEASYYDTVNGSSYIKQIFYLNKINGQWLISNMKVLEFSKFAKYYSDDFQKSELDILNITDNGFDFYLFVISNEGDGNQYYAGEIEGSAKFITPDHAVFKDDNCQLDFYFNDKNTVKIVDQNCEKYRNSKTAFTGTFKEIYSDEPLINMF